MAGKYPINHQTVVSIQKWLDTLAVPDGWHGNNLHIDEINGFRRVKRRDWVRSSLDILPLMLHLADPGLGLKYFLHIGLLNSQFDQIPTRLDEDWFSKEVHLWTPPSFLACSPGYFDSTYKPYLVSCVVEPLLKISGVEFSVCLQSSYDLEEKSFERDLYLFANPHAGFRYPVEQFDSGAWQNPLLGKKYELILHDLPETKREWSRELDLTVKFETGETYQATAFTLRYIKVYFHRLGAGYFWAKDMLIVSDLKDKTLKVAVEKSIREGYFYEIFSKNP
jgi:hypothetical protein